MTYSENIRRIYDELDRAPELTPSPRINELFSALVRAVTSCMDDERAPLTATETARLQDMCSRGEFELERHWAERITTAAHPEEELRRFPYLQNYRDLTTLEWSAFRECQQHAEHRVLFCGGGPLPLTAIMLAREFHVPSTVLDVDPSAVAAASALVERLGLTEHIRIVHADAMRFTAYDEYSVIFVAALAGLMPQEKEHIFAAIKAHAKPDTHIIARSSWGNRKLLYRPLSKHIEQQFQPVLRVDPRNDVVNSVVILKTP
ncbi:MAG: nicotianamine synthase family protein [bacterium]|nr:nicotianamine synthase family protein [bacterium]